jgi:GNAT superfamily N-acetyltransferase
MDGVHRYAVAAFDDAGEIIGVAEYVQAEPEPTAEVAVVVDRGWQRHGIGTTLLARLADHAASVGITTVTALVSGSNGQVLELVDELPVPHQISYDHGEGVLKAELPSQS